MAEPPAPGEFAWYRPSVTWRQRPSWQRQRWSESAARQHRAAVWRTPRPRRQRRRRTASSGGHPWRRCWRRRALPSITIGRGMRPDQGRARSPTRVGSPATAVREQGARIPVLHACPMARTKSPQRQPQWRRCQTDWPGTLPYAARAEPDWPKAVLYRLPAAFRSRRYVP